MKQKDIIDWDMIDHRIALLKKRHLEEGEDRDIANAGNRRNFQRIDERLNYIPQNFPRELIRRFQITFVCPLSYPIMYLRSIRASKLGKMILVNGIVTRIGDVKPELKIATFLCDSCAKEQYQKIDSLDFTPLQKCESKGCRGQLELQIPHSKFTKFQEIVIQETPEEVPIGSIPRTIKVYARGELVQLCSPGDRIQVTGVFMQVPLVGSKTILGGKMPTYVDALDIQRNKKRYQEIDYEQYNNQIEEDHQRMPFLSNDRKNDMFTKLARSIAPEIFGMEDVKKALLLMLAGGVTKELHKGSKIRGDINICLMGDPGIAKSQLLRYVAMLSPRGIFTSGKGSSGVGLTAAVVKDSLTNELVLEGGALVLADNGICCIDEFDKMSDYDRTALHEVMEQQSVSIAKAGITTTLNARASVLAAANPAFGRYNTRKTPMENINIPAALLSRFDLLFLLLDKQDAKSDFELAKHILQVHDIGAAPEEEGAFPINYLKAYIAKAKNYEPFIPKSQKLVNYITQLYSEMRNKSDSMNNRTSEYATPRTLLGILRLSQALARLRFASSVSEIDVREAYHLILASKAQLGETRWQKPKSASERIYELIRELSELNDERKVRLDDVRAEMISRSLNPDDLEACLREHEKESIWMVNSEGTTVQFI